MRVLHEYWKLENLGNGEYLVEADGMASSVVSVYSHDAMEMLLAHMVEELLAVSQGETLQ
jgi:hypothetical protein